MRPIFSGLLSGCALAALTCAIADEVLPDWPGKQQLTTYGHTGLLEMPSARMMDDGEFAVTISNAPETFRTAMSFQVFPWLEAGFRYSQIDSFFLPDGRDENLYDRSFSLKLRLLDETQYLPAVAVGFNDLIGTGIYGGEYVVMSKNFGDFDFTLGMGFGRMGSVGHFKNPLTYISDYFETRPVFVPGDSQGGEVLFDTAFRGRDAGLFGGVVWQTPIDNLNAIVEYSSDAYALEEERGLLKIDSQVNFGLSYRYANLIDTSLAWLYGNTISFRVSLRFDPTVEAMKVLEPSPVPPAVRPPEQRARAAAQAAGGAEGPVADLSGLRGIQLASADDDWSLDGYIAEAQARQAQDAGRGGAMQEIMTSGRWYEVPAIRDQIVDSIVTLGKSQKLGLEAIILKPNYVSVYYDNDRYTRETELLHRLMRVLTALPPSVEHFYMTSVVQGFPSTEVLVSRTAYERAVDQFASVDNLLQYTKIGPGGMEIPEEAVRLGSGYPRFDWSIAPTLRTLVFDNKEPFKIGLTLALSGSVDFEGGWKAEAILTGDLIDTVKEAVPGDSVLPHVRTDFRLYRDEGQYGIQTIQVSKTGKLSSDWFYQVKAGYLEDMFGGVGGEVVWRPQGSNVAYGANVYYVKQRDYDRLFGFRDYDVVTGHVSLYWQDALWRGVNVNVHAGRYLAGDWGATLEVTRKFDSGVEIGAFATFTDVPFEEFGEGSFDKGLILRVPFGWIAPFNTKYEASTRLSSLIRDGGQRLYEDNPLWEQLRDTNESEIRRTWPLDVTPGL
jgi:hypothetical protein